MQMADKENIVRYATFGIAQEEFDKAKITPVMNPPDLFMPAGLVSPQNKPKGGLWASRTDSKDGWKDWCVSENFNLGSFDRCSCFHLKEDAKILQINRADDVNEMRKNYRTIGGEIDFERIAEDYDAIEVTTMGNGLYWALYGWDCESIVVLNADAVEVDDIDRELSVQMIAQAQAQIAGNRDDYEEDEELEEENDENIGY